MSSLWLCCFLYSLYQSDSLRSKNDGFAKIELKSLKVASNYLKPKELKFAIEVIAQNRDDFERIWDEWFNQS